VSFEAGIVELGGHPMILRSDEMQRSRGESVKDTALVLSRHVDAVGVRTGPDAVLEELAENGTIPVFNMLTAGHHPCQALADLLTLREAFGRLDGLKLAYVGDGNNVARSLVVLGGLAGVEVVPRRPATASTAWRREDPARPAARTRSTSTSGSRWATRHGPRAPPRRAPPRRRPPDRAAPGAIALHDLPAHAGEEITPRSLRRPPAHLDQAENRRHAQKALLEWLLATTQGRTLHRHTPDRSGIAARICRAGRRTHGGERRRRGGQLRAARSRGHCGRAVTVMIAQRPPPPPARCRRDGRAPAPEDDSPFDAAMAVPSPCTTGATGARDARSHARRA
jgi:ornithine carbamoyltransferase